MPDTEKINMKKSHKYFNLPKIDEDIKVLQENFAVHIPKGKKATFMIVASFCIMLYLSWKLSLTYLTCICVAAIFVQCFKNKDDIRAADQQ